MRLIKWIAVQVKKLNKQKNEQFMLNPHVNINEKCKTKCKQKKENEKIQTCITYVQSESPTVKNVSNIT